MPRTTLTYDLLLSCPGDVINEQEIVQKVIDDFNSAFGKRLNTNIQYRHWSKDSVSEMGAEPQALLDKQFINDCDIILCVLKNRLGTPTQKYESGTIHEFKEAIKNGKEVALYFSDEPISPSEIDHEEKLRVEQFKAEFIKENLGLFQSYKSQQEFEELVTKKIFSVIMDSDNGPQKNDSKLKIQGIKKNTPSEAGHLERVFPNFDKNQEALLKKIFDNISLISASKIVNDNSSEPKKFRLMAEEYTLDQNIVENITHFAKQNNIELSESFFKLGDLYSEWYLGGLGASYKVSGTPEEKQKHQQIQETSLYISQLREWEIYEAQFKDKRLVRLCLSNVGSIFESDITLTLEIPKKDYFFLDLLSSPQKTIIEEINESDLVNEKFGSSYAKDILEYHRNRRTSYVSTHGTLPSFADFQVPSYEDLEGEYKSAIEYIMDFEIFDEEDKYFLVYEFKELKQHTNMSFPSALLVSNTLKEIKYEINSKNSPEKFVGKINIESAEDLVKE